MIQAQIYREWGVAIVKGRAECLLALLECSTERVAAVQGRLREVAGQVD